MPTLHELRAIVVRYRMQSAVTAVSLAVLITSVVVGMSARRTLGPMRAEFATLRAASSEIAAFRSSFKASAPEQDLRVAELAESLSVVISRDARVGVARDIAANAESLGLTNVRVRVAPPDSAPAPARPEQAGASVSVADYSLSLDCTGALSALLSVVQNLPASVALQRIVASSARGRTHFHVGLAVFESGSAPAGIVPNPGLASLVAYAAPLPDTLAVLDIDPDGVALRRDPFANSAEPRPRLAGNLVARSIARTDSAPRRTVDESQWRVSATLIGGAQRAAIINDVLLRVGDTLPGGVRLTSVERDQVVLTDAKGTAHTVAVKEGRADAYP